MVLLIILNVKSNFNFVKRSDMLWALEANFHVPSYLLRHLGSYLKDYTLLYKTKKGLRRTKLTAGVAQYILFPDLWNVSYDGIKDGDAR